MVKCKSVLMFFLLSILSITLISAFSVSLTPQDSYGKYIPLTTFSYNFNFSTSSLCSDSLLSSYQILRTDVAGRNVAQIDTSLLSGIPSYLCEYRDSNVTLRKAHPFPDGIFNRTFAQSGNFSNNLSAKYFIGDGRFLTNINTTNGSYLTSYTETDPIWNANKTLYPLNSSFNSTQFQIDSNVTIKVSWLESIFVKLTTLLGFNYYNSTNFPYTHLSNFTDNLGNRGYTSLSNFTNDGVFITQTYGNLTYALNSSLANYYLATNPSGYINWANAVNGTLMSQATYNSNYSNFYPTILSKGIGNVVGVGSFGYIPMWNGTSSLNNSNMFQLGSNIGIGTTSPSNPLQVLSTTIPQMRVSYDSTRYLTISHAGLAGEYGAGANNLAFSVNSSSAGSGNIEFYTASGGALTSRLKITNAGLVGIGDTTPYSELSVLYNGFNADPSLTFDATAIANFDNGQTDLAITTSQASPFTTSIQHRHSTLTGYSYPIALNPLGGNVGIGTTSPLSILHIDADSAASSVGVIIESNSSKSGSVSPRLGLVDAFSTNPGSSAPAWFIDNYITDFRIFQKPNITTTSESVAFFIESTNNNVGIGTTSPSDRLSIDGVEGFNVSFGMTNNRNAYLRFEASGGVILDGDNDDTGRSFGFYNHGLSSPLMTILEGGNVGIGTTAPASKLHLYHTNNLHEGLIIDNPGTGTGQQSIINLMTLGDGTKKAGVAGVKGWEISARGNAYTVAGEQNDLHFGYADGTSWTNSLHLDYGGNVGIGTASPDARLTIGGGDASNNVVQSFFNSAGAVKGYIGIIGTAGNYVSTGAVGDYFIRSQTGDILFATTTGATERMRIANGGNVGIGNAAPPHTLTVTGAISFSNTTQLATGTLSYITIGSNFVLQRTSSSGLFKENIVNISKEQSDKIMQLNPAFYQREGTGKNEMGLIADEVEKVNPDWVVYDIIGNNDLGINESTIIPFSVNYQSIGIATLFKVQEQQRIIIQQNNTINNQQILLNKICKNNPELCK